METEVVSTCVPCSGGAESGWSPQAMLTLVCLFFESSDMKGQKHCFGAQGSLQLLLVCFQ